MGGLPAHLQTCILSDFRACERPMGRLCRRQAPAQRTVMIEEPPPIVFAPSIERPSADIVERFRAPPALSSTR